MQKARGIEAAPDDLLERARAFEETLTRFRDHYIVHPRNVRHHAATMLFPTGEVEVSFGIAMPTDAELDDFPEAPAVRETSEQLDGYLAAVLAWAESLMPEMTTVESGPVDEI